MTDTMKPRTGAADLDATPGGARPSELSRDQAVAVAISTTCGSMVMDDCVASVPGFLAHLAVLGYTVTELVPDGE